MIETSEKPWPEVQFSQSYSIQNIAQFPKDHTPRVRPDLVPAVHFCFFVYFKIYNVTILFKISGKMPQTQYMTIHHSIEVALVFNLLKDGEKMNFKSIIIYGCCHSIRVTFINHIIFLSIFIDFT